MLDNDKAILLIRGEKPVIDFKYDILKHPNVKYTADGDGKMYEHGEVTRATGEIQELTILYKIEPLEKGKELTEDEILKLKDVLIIQDFDDKNFNYELLSEEDIEEYLNEIE